MAGTPGEISIQIFGQQGHTLVEYHMHSFFRLSPANLHYEHLFSVGGPFPCWGDEGGDYLFGGLLISRCGADRMLCGIS